MIQYTLKCDKDHQFDSWFQSAQAFDKLKAAGMVACSVCGSLHVEKAIMAPRVRPARSAASTRGEPDAVTTPQNPARPLSQPASPAEQALADLKREVEKNADYVGSDFAREARAMHDGDTPERSIYGEARPEEAKALVEDGIPVAPLPFRPGRKNN